MKNKTVLFTLAACALAGSFALLDCHLDITCITAQNCENGQVCVLSDAGAAGGPATGQCQDAPADAGTTTSSGTTSGTGGASTASSSGTTTSSSTTTTTASSSSTSTTSSGGGCTGSSGCPAGDYCNVSTCAACSVDAHCGATCAACSGSTPHCLTNTCVACTQNSDCSGLEMCCSNHTCAVLCS